jgi:hypothetical protein
MQAVQNQPAEKASPQPPHSPGSRLENLINNQLAHSDVGIDPYQQAGTDIDTKQPPAGTPPKVAALYTQLAAKKGVGGAALYAFKPGYGVAHWRDAQGKRSEMALFDQSGKKVATGKLGADGLYKWKPVSAESEPAGISSKAKPVEALINQALGHNDDGIDEYQKAGTDIDEHDAPPNIPPKVVNLYKKFSAQAKNGAAALYDIGTAYGVQKSTTDGSRAVMVLFDRSGKEIGAGKLDPNTSLFTWKQ